MKSINKSVKDFDIDVLLELQDVLLRGHINQLKEVIGHELERRGRETTNFFKQAEDAPLAVETESGPEHLH